MHRIHFRFVYFQFTFYLFYFLRLFSVLLDVFMIDLNLFGAVVGSRMIGQSDAMFPSLQGYGLIGKSSYLSSVVLPFPSRNC